MKKFYQFIVLCFLTANYSAQVGILTSNPKSTLQIQKKPDLNYPDGLILPRISGDSLKLKDAAYGPNQHGLMVFVTSATTNPTLKTQNVISPGVFMYDGYFIQSDSSTGRWNQMASKDPVNAGDAYAMRASGNVGLLNLGVNLLGSAVYTLPIVNASAGAFNVEIPSSQVNNNGYVVPSNGLYSINYSYRTGQGIRAELLGAVRPGIIITKTKSSVTTTLDSRLFGGVNLLDLSPLPSVVNISLTQGQISHIYKLDAGDVLRFGIVRGGLNVSLLTDTSAELSIIKIR